MWNIILEYSECWPTFVIIAATTQTVLSLPLDFDLQAMLGKYHLLY